MTSKSPDTPQSTEPDAGPAKPQRKLTNAAVRTLIAAQGRATVYVVAEHAHRFRRPPRDGNVYIVEDPNRNGVLHWTDREGRYSCLEEKNALLVPVSSTKGPRKKKPKKLVRRVEQLPPSALLQSVPDADPVPIRLIKLERVMQITGFGKSFLYEQADFPRPVKLGIAKRAAVRWSEAEVTEWVSNLLAGRGGQVEE